MLIKTNANANNTIMNKEESLIQELAGYNIFYIEKFKSKRNNVYKVLLQNKAETRTAVLKLYTGEDAEHKCKNEYEALCCLKDNNILVPGIIAKDETSMLLEYTKGETLAVIIEELEARYWIDSLADWFAKLHKLEKNKQSMLKCDSNLKNFIYTDAGIIGLDFEEISYGNPIDDIADICYYIISYRPSFNKSKDEMLRQFLAAYSKYSGRRIDNIAKYIWISGKKTKEIRKRFAK